METFIYVIFILSYHETIKLKQLVNKVSLSDNFIIMTLKQSFVYCHYNFCMNLSSRKRFMTVLNPEKKRPRPLIKSVRKVVTARPINQKTLMETQKILFFQKFLPKIRGGSLYSITPVRLLRTTEFVPRFTYFMHWKI